MAEKDIVEKSLEGYRFIEAYNESKARNKEGGIHNMSDAINTIVQRETRKARNEGVDLMAKLVDMLVEANRYADVKRVSKDPAYRDKLMKEYKLVG